MSPLSKLSGPGPGLPPEPETLRVPFHRPDLGQDEIESVAAVLRSGWLTTGPVAAQLEQEICRLTGSRFAIAVSSCTAGLHAALIAAGVGPGDEVITTPLTFCGAIQAIEETGAVPVMVDVADDLNLDPARIPAAITPRTRAILPLHLGGLPCDLHQIHQIAAAHRLAVIEDAAHALGAEWKHCPIGGSRASSAVFSFYANKNVTTGEGGAVATSDPEFASRLREFSRHGIQRNDPRAHSGWRYEVVARGFKSNLSDILAAVGVAQLRKFENLQARRAAIAARYDALLAPCRHFLHLPPRNPNSRHAWHLYAIRLKLDRLGIARDAFISALERAGVGCSIHFRPIFLHPWYRRLGSPSQWPVALRESQRLISLPIFPSLSIEEQHYVVEQIMAVACREGGVC